MRHYFIFAGESSADLHGSRLIRALKNEVDPSSICGVGGPRMRQELFECFHPMEDFQVMGFSDVICALPRLWNLFKKIRNHILKLNPDCVILIDYPGFNLRLAQSLRKKGFKGKLVQYICPTVWAHGKKRIDILNQYYNLLLTIYPFEAKYFANRKLKVEYIGNPLIETIQTHNYDRNWMSKMGLPIEKDLIALFPGSRLGEIKRHIPKQLEMAAQLIEEHPNLHFALSCAQESLQRPILKMIEKGPLRIERDIHIIAPKFNYDLMKNAKTALAKSGTVTLELALHNVPTIVHYEVSSINYLFAKYILKLNLSHYCIVNILSDTTLFPEFIGKDLSTDKIKEAFEQIHFNPLRHENMEMACKKLKEELGTASSHQQAVRAIQEMMKC